MGEAEADGPRRARRGSPLLNANRMRVFQYLCRMPCSHLRTIAEGVALGSPTVAWHLERLTKEGLVEGTTVGKRKVYYPARLVPAASVEPLHAATDEVVRGALLSVMARPGSTVGEIADERGAVESGVRRAVRTLVRVGLLDRVRDGRYWRYFPADAVNDLSRDSRKRARQFKRSLLRDLQQAGLRPEVDVSPRGESVITVAAGGTRLSIVVPDDPLESILVGEGKVP